MRILTIAASISLIVLAAGLLPAAAQPAPVAPSEVQPRLFAVEITVGAKWDHAKQPRDQAFFREHSANLQRLRDLGVLVVGARYGDKGLLVLAASTEPEIRTMLDEDPSFSAEVFKYTVHPFGVFYGGTLSTPARK
jgi:hypothetical protein